MKHLIPSLALLCFVTGCGPAPKPDSRIALAHQLHRWADSTQTVAVGTMKKLGYDNSRIESEEKQVAGYLQDSQAILAQLDKLDSAKTDTVQLKQLLAQEGAIIRTSVNASRKAAQDARDLNSMKALMGGK